MSVGLDIAAGIAGLITLSDIVITRTYRTIKACKNASKESCALLKHVQALLGVLRGVQSLADEAENASLESCIPVDEVLNCQATLEALRDRLVSADPSDARVSTLTKWKRTMQWPISADETQGVLEDLDRYMTVFDVSLSVEILNTVLVSAKHNNSIATTIERTARDVQEMLKSMEFVTNVILRQERRSVLTFFKALDAAEYHAARYRRRHNYVKLPLTEDLVLGQWRANSKLLIFGKPGSGKSELMWTFIETIALQHSPQHGIAYYYCSLGQSLQSILCCLAGQLAQQNQAAFELSYRLFNERLGQSSPSDEELVDLLRHCVACFDNVSIMVDGLDECDDPYRVAHVLWGLAVHDGVRVLVSSRPSLDMKAKLVGLETFNLEEQRTYKVETQSAITALINSVPDK